jgi:peptidoglycan hydrolase-like protein with peptidoglycan-binding domain
MFSGQVACTSPQLPPAPTELLWLRRPGRPTVQISRRTALVGIAAAVPLASAALAAPAMAAPSTAGSPPASSGGGVLGVQRWLNTTFGGVPGWVHVTEDGQTGAATATGLAQGAQSLLGITPVVPAVGPANRRGLERHGDVGDETGPDAGTWFRLAQAGLVCAGFSTVTMTGSWDAPTVAAVGALRGALGAAPAGPAMSPHLFGSLLTTDAVRLSPGGSPTIRTVQQYLNRTYAEAAGGAYGSTSGLPDASTAQAVVRAIQIAASADVVDGAWGSGTAASLRAAAASVVGVGATGPWVQLVKALLVLNREHVEFDDVFTPADAQVVRAFQQFQAFPTAEQTGTCGFGTWAALAASSGDAGRPTTGADMATRLDTTRAAALSTAGVRIVGRYLTNHRSAGARDKALTIEELRVLAAAGLGLWPVFEEGGTEESWFTVDQGIADAHRAHDAARRLGLPKQTTLYFAVDFDATPAQTSSAVLPYFRGVARGLRDRGDQYEAGVYGSRQVCTTVSSAGLAHFSFVGGLSTGWVGNQLVPLPSNWSFNQVQARTVGTGDAETDVDANVVSGRDRGVTAARLGR